MLGKRTTEAPSRAPVTQARPADEVGARFLEAIAQRDFPGLASCFAADARSRALLPRGLREASGPDEPARWFEGWFGPADRVELLSRGSDAIADRRHLTWRLRVHGAAGARVIEQQAYATIRDGRIEALDLLCSGFRPEPSDAGPACDAAARAPLPPAAARLDGGDASCATLTPLVRAKLRELESGQVLEVVTGEPTAAQDLASFCALTGHSLVESAVDGARRRFHLRKK